MNFLADVHLSVSFSKFLNQQIDCSCIHVNQVLQKWNTPDEIICNYADENNLIVITKDADFKDSHFIKDTPKKVVRITMGNISNSELIDLFTKYLPFILSVSKKESFYIELSREQLLIND